MDPRKRERLEAAGWKVGSTQEFLGLSDEEAAYVEMKMRLGEALRRRRALRDVSQQALARKLGSSQSRVSRMEAADPSVTLDLLVRALVALGATPDEIGQALAGGTDLAVSD
ncbi:MAG TPA: helix-turn-helix transcriptional regulator [Longimicrobium sp.]|nr:helix-turn-helix transcriptional regulator [Longimicrobium sp.]